MRALNRHDFEHLTLYEGVSISAKCCIILHTYSIKLQASRCLLGKHDGLIMTHLV